MSNKTNLENNNEQLLNIDNKLKNSIIENIINLPAYINLNKANAIKEDITLNKTAYTNLGKIAGIYETPEEQIEAQEQIINNLEEKISNIDSIVNTKGIPVESYMIAPNLKFGRSININTSKWDTVAVREMNYYFADSTFNTIDVSNFKTYSVYTMSGMFYNCIYLKNLNIANWNVVSVRNITNMFYNCNNLSNESINSIIDMILNIQLIDNLNLSTESPSSPFYGSNITNIKYQDRWSELEVKNINF